MDHHQPRKSTCEQPPPPADGTGDLDPVLHRRGLLRGQAVVHRCSLSSDFIRARTLDAIAAQKVPEYFGNLLGPGFIQGDVSPEFIGRVP